MAFGQFATTADKTPPFAIQLRGHFKDLSLPTEGGKFKVSFRCLKESIIRASPIYLSTPPRIEFLWAGQPSFSKALVASVRVFWGKPRSPLIEHW